MGSHPINLVLRFLLEMTALFSMGLWGWNLSQSPLPIITALAVPLLSAILWGTFAVPDDPSRSGKAPVPTPGFLRLVLELLFFGCAVFMLYSLDYRIPAIVFGSITAIHYALSYDRIIWLIRPKP